MRVSASDTRTIRMKLVRWYEQARRDLPWRRTRDPYAIWVSEIMLQQTQVVTVIPYYERFLRRFPTAKALASARLDDVLEHWKGLGYYSRARNLHAAARIIAEQYGGKLPDSVDGLRALPGFGRYTAGAVASIAYGVCTPLVDGNVGRVFARLFALDKPLNDKACIETLWAIAASLVDEKRPGDFNQALMELGALVCKPEKAECAVCPLKANCLARRENRVAELPVPKIRKARKPLHLAVFLACDKNRILFGRRHDRGLFGGLWELPSVELTHKSADVPSLFEATFNCKPRSLQPLGRVERTLTHRDLSMTVYAVKSSARWATPLHYSKLEWAPLVAHEKRAMSSAMRAAMKLALRVKI
jgi:A/G-specific adenine glycosylase